MAPDSAGAAFGCLGALVLMSTLDGLSAMLMVGAIGAVASLRLRARWPRLCRSTLPLWLGVLQRPGLLATHYVGSATRHLNRMIANSRLSPVLSVAPRKIRTMPTDACRILLCVHRLWHQAAAQQWRLLRVLFLRLRGLSANAG